MRTIKKVLGSRIMILPLADTRVMGSGIEIESDGESLPIARVVGVGEGITSVEEGDIIHYVLSRESGRCRHDDKEHFIIPISNAIAITDE